MRKLLELKYLNVLVIPFLVFLCFQYSGWVTFSPLLFSFVFVPLLEFAYKPDSSNLSEVEEEERIGNAIYDWQIYLMVPVQWTLVYFFLHAVSDPNLATLDLVGRITGMGLACGVIGINVAHELGHRSTKHEQFMSKALLLTSLYMHFYIEHNRGHHKNVSTNEDPSSARYGENLYHFWIRSVFFSYLSAWKIEAKRLKKAGKASFSIHNEMLIFQIVQAGLLTLIGLYFGWMIMIYFILAATMGFLLLETVNYIEHYGLQRDKKGEGYERVLPHHSWNSDHIIGRVMLFELSRHSDHHFIASRKYQVLRHMDDSPQMPTGYPGMMLLATVPPLWFLVMNPRIKKIKEGDLELAA